MFFLIGNIRIIIDEKMKKKLTMCSWEWTQQSTKQNTTENNQETKLREEKKKLNKRRTFCKTPTPRPIKKTSLA